LRRRCRVAAYMKPAPPVNNTLRASNTIGQGAIVCDGNGSGVQTANIADLNSSTLQSSRQLRVWVCRSLSINTASVSSCVDELVGTEAVLPDRHLQTQARSCPPSDPGFADQDSFRENCADELLLSGQPRVWVCRYLSIKVASVPDCVDELVVKEDVLLYRHLQPRFGVVQTAVQTN
jgi:hypothetical protein